MRARQTAALVVDAAGLDAEIEFTDRIYDAGAGDLTTVVAGIDNKYDSAMLVGHNPGMEDLVRFLTERVEPMPTAALAVIGLNIGDWSSIGYGCGKLKAIFRPRNEIK
jgi:phosphohistidine phosphatase